ncbi:hypothetical protein LAWI1_G000404 [Lachnellula willkommii]|uniref:Uncharacterized protein n=1 Tax=Lachnellula willkommii TaxID=215461 RepID=A0A559MKQ2_9HELO|nr:hypothetical protein LAWI1_G000404 [Lachnellula willkommii]
MSREAYQPPSQPQHPRATPLAAGLPATAPPSIISAATATARCRSRGVIPFGARSVDIVCFTRRGLREWCSLRLDDETLRQMTVMGKKSDILVGFGEQEQRLEGAIKN